MLIGIPKEIRAGQTLVAATPNTVQKLISLGYTVSVEQGAGELANYFDQQFEEAGASLVSTAEACSYEGRCHAPFAPRSTKQH